MQSSIFDRAKAVISPALIEEHFSSPGAEWRMTSRGREYYTLNPLRGDRSIGSFAISESGLYYDYADNSYKGDFIDLLAKKNSITNKEAAELILGESSDMPAIREVPTRPAPEEPSELIDSGNMVPSLSANYLTKYIDHESGKTAFFVARYKSRTPGKRIIFPLSWDGKAFQRKIWSFYKKRPMLPLAFETGPIIVVEGEKCYHEATSYFERTGKKCSVTTWHGGTGCVDMVVLPPGIDNPDRVKVLWPDNDSVGIDAMINIARRIGDDSTFILRPPAGVEQGWDIADAIEEGRDVADMISSLYKRTWPQIEWRENGIKGPTKVGDLEKIEEIDDGRAVVDGLTPLDVDFKGYQWTELGIAEFLVATFRDSIAYNYDRNAWGRCVNGIWSFNDPSAMTPLYKYILNKIDDGTKDRAMLANMCEKSSKINAILSLASREVGIPVRETDFDREDHIVMCKDVAIDLRTGDTISRAAAHYISKSLPVSYNKDATCPVFMQFLNDITLGREEIIEFFRRWFGLCLTGDMSAQVFAIFYGTGANGKSTLVETISKIMGDYAKTAPADTFTSKPYSGGIPNDIAGLRGARMVLTTETEQNARLAESKVKTITGGDKISARFMRGEFFEFYPSWKIIISTNHRPRVSGGDHSIWRRIILIPFEFTCPTDKMDATLPKKLWEEREGILAWMVSGAVDYYKDGCGRAALKVPELAKAATEEYRADEDVIGRFISEACYIGDELKRHSCPMPVKASAVLDSYRRWCERNNEIAAGRTSNIAFVRALTERGFETKMLNGGYKGYRDICPKDILEQDEEDKYGR